MAIGQIIPLVKQQVAIDGKATAYVCENYACQMPTAEVDQMLSLIELGD